MTDPKSTAPHVRMAAVDDALILLRQALIRLSEAGARKTAARVRAAISSAKGAQRNADNRYFKSERSA